MIDSFVYCWTDRFNSKLYVGFHKGTPDDGYVCSSKHMKKEYESRPLDFTREILATGTYDDCRKFESKVIQAMLDQNIPCYNLNVNGAIVFTPEIRAKISATHKGKIITESHREALRAWNKTRPPASEETKEKIRQSKLGKKRKPFTEEAKRNMALARLGKKRPPEIGEAISARQLGTKRKNPYPESGREKNRIASTGRKHSAETIEKLKAAKSNVTEETRAKMSEARIAFWARKKGLLND